jgi:hypothetical protein
MVDASPPTAASTREEEEEGARRAASDDARRRRRARDGATSTRDAVDAAVAIVLFESRARLRLRLLVVRDVNFLIGV